MARLTPDQEQRQRKREERLRRERMRRRRQTSVLVAVVAIIAIAGTAFALRPTASPVAAGQGSSASTASHTATAGAAPGSTATAEASHVAQVTTPTPAPAPTPAPKPAKVTTAAATVSLASIKPLSPAPGVKTIIVDKSDQRVTLYTAKGKPVDTFRCASGIIYPRVGTYTVFGHDPESFALADNTHFYFFTKFAKSDKNNNIGFHSVPQTPDGKLVGKLGVPVSHGCVRLAKAKAKFVYSWAVNGTKVIVRR